MNQQGVTVNRSLVGLIAIVLICAAGVLAVLAGDGQELWSGACLKVGVVMAAFWLALPSFSRNGDLGQASWTALLVALGAALIVARTKVPLKIVLPALGVMVVIVRVLRPRNPAPHRPPRSDSVR